MTQTPTLEKYIIITPNLRYYRIDCHNVLRGVRGLTAWTVVLEHENTTVPPTVKDIIKLANLDPNTTIYVLKHSSGSFSILMPNNEADMHRIISHAAELAPRYLVRRIQLMEEPTPARTFSPPKVAELGDLQCFLRDYFAQRCAKWQEEKARREQLKKEIRDGPTQQLIVTAEDKRTRMGSQRGGSADSFQHQPDDSTSTSNSVSGPSTLLRARALQRSPGTDRRSRSESPPRSSTSCPPPSPPPPSNPPNDDTAQAQPTAELRAARAHANEIYWEVLDVMLTGVPLLHELLGGVPAEEAGASEDSSESNGRRLVPALDILDESLAEQIREVIRLRRRIEDNTDPRLDSYDLAVLDAFRTAGERVRRAKEEATRRELDGPSR